MKKYEYVNLEIYNFLSSGNEEHRAIIDDYASKGYRYVGYIPTRIEAHGKVDSIDLIFEIEA